MIIFAILIGLMIVGMALIRWLDAISFFIIFVAGLLLLLASVLLPISYYVGLSDIKRYEAFKTTITKARLNASEAERTAILMQITRWNQELASAKYWNETIFDIYIPDEFAKLPLIE